MLQFLFKMIVLLLFTSAVNATGQQQLNTFLKDLKTYQTTFTQTVLDQDQNTQYHSTGTFYLSRPDHFLWQYDEPSKLYILADGRWIWLVDEDLEQVTQRGQHNALQGTPAQILSSDIDLEKEFELQDMDEHLGLSWLQLIPKNTNSQFETIMLAFADGVLHKLEMTDKFGQTTRFDFSNGARNQPFDPLLFVFQAPHGFDILQQDE